MKKLILQTLILLSPCAATSQTVIHWEPEIEVADGAVYGNIRPRIVLNGEGMPVVLFGKGPEGILQTATFNGSGFESPVLFLPPTMETYLASWTGPDLAAKGDTIVVVFKAMPIEGGKVYAVRSTDGGTTYSDTIRVDNHDSGVAWMPSLDMDENGNPTVTYMAHDASMMNPRYTVVHSLDQGQTYEPEMEITSAIPDEACDCCPAEYVIDGNKHALLYRNNDANIRDIYAVYSNDDGLTFPENENVDQLGWAITSCPSTGPHGIFKDDTLVTVYASRANGSYRVYISKTTTNPLFQFENRTMMTPPTNTNGIQNYPRIDHQNDTIVMAWQESESSNPEIFCAYTTIGNTDELLTTKHIVNSNTTGSQTNPDIAVKDGFVHLVYQDSPSGSVIYRRGIFGTAGIAENDPGEVILYPNPVTDGQFHLKTKTNEIITEMKMINSSGIILPLKFEQKVNFVDVSTDHLSDGMYFLEVTLKSGTIQTIKLTINN